MFGLGGDLTVIIGGVVAAAFAVLAAFGIGKRSGRDKERLKMKEQDDDRADDIRRRARSDVADRVRRYDDSGWRD